MKIENILEAALFCADEPMSPQRLKALFAADEQPDAAAIRQVLEEIQEKYQERGVHLVELSSGFQFQSASEFAQYWQRMHEKKPPRASKSYLETLAIIAYKQPATRADVEHVRGVAVNSQVIRSLQDRGWIKCLGYRDVPGKPAMYGTTKSFLDDFGLKSLTDLPELREVMDFDKVDKKVSEQLELAIGGSEDVAEGGAAIAADGETAELKIDPINIEENEAELDAAYEEASQLFTDCEDLLQKANPNSLDVDSHPENTDSHPDEDQDSENSDSESSNQLHSDAELA